MSSLVEQVREHAAATPVPGWPAWASALREQGAEAFTRHGLPTARVEAWKYTPLNRRPIGEILTAAGGAIAELPAAIHGLGEVTRLVFVDGQFAGIDGDLPVGVEVVSLDAAIAADDAELAEWLLEPPLVGVGDALTALNAATLGTGAVVRVDPAIDAGRLVVEWHVTDEGKGHLANSRLCLALGSKSRLTVFECFGRCDHGSADRNLVTQVRLGEQAEFTHARLQSVPADTMLLSHVRVEQAAGSHYQYDGLDLGAGLARHDLFVRLAGEGARCDLNGAYLPRGEAHVDYHLAVEHRAEHCTSSQFFRGVVDDRARAVWNGRVHVLPGADHTEALQSNANLLLSRDAEVDTKPELEIEADEVVASHGATVGQLDETAIFYLRSRGLDEALARELLIGAYCQAAVDRAGDEVVRERLTSELARYTGVNE